MNPGWNSSSDACCPLRNPGMDYRRNIASNQRLLPTAAQPQNGGGRLWDKLNRILGDNRKVRLPPGEELKEHRMPLPENAPARPADVTPPESEKEAPPSNDEQVGEFENLASSGDLVDDCIWGDSLEEASRSFRNRRSGVLPGACELRAGRCGMMQHCRVDNCQRA